MPQRSDMLPPTPASLWQDLKALRREFNEFRAARRLESAAIGAGGLTIRDGGRLAVTTPAGQDVLYIGRIDPSHPDGSPQQGIIARREDGTVALSIWTGAGSGVQPLVVWDHLGHGIVAEDLVAGGLAAPYLAADGWFGAVEQPTFTTTSGTFSTVTHLPYIKQHPRVTAYYLVRASDGATSGEIRLVDDSGTQIGSTVTVGLGAFFYGSITGSLAGSHMSEQYLHWQARTTAGAGTIGVKGLSTYGVQS